MNVEENVQKFHLEDCPWKSCAQHIDRDQIARELRSAEEMFQKWTFTEKQALLAHAAALNIECQLAAGKALCL